MAKEISGGYEIAPLVIAIAGVAVAAAGTAYSASRSAAASRYNRAVAQQAAEQAAQVGKSQADQQREQYRRIMAANRAITGAAGVEGGQGSPLLVAADNARTAELNALWTEYAGKTQQEKYLQQAELFRMRAGADQTAGLLATSGTLLSGSYDLYRSYNRPSVWGSGVQGQGVSFGAEVL